MCRKKIIASALSLTFIVARFITPDNSLAIDTEQSKSVESDKINNFLKKAVELTKTSHTPAQDLIKYTEENQISFEEIIENKDGLEKAGFTVIVDEENNALSINWSGTRSKVNSSQSKITSVDSNANDSNAKSDITENKKAISQDCDSCKTRATSKANIEKELSLLKDSLNSPDIKCDLSNAKLHIENIENEMSNVNNTEYHQILIKIHDGINELKEKILDGKHNKKEESTDEELHAFIKKHYPHLLSELQERTDTKNALSEKEEKARKKSISETKFLRKQRIDRLKNAIEAGAKMSNKKVEDMDEWHTYQTEIELAKSQDELLDIESAIYELQNGLVQYEKQKEAELLKKQKNVKKKVEALQNKIENIKRNVKKDSKVTAMSDKINKESVGQQAPMPQPAKRVVSTAKASSPASHFVAPIEKKVEDTK